MDEPIHHSQGKYRRPTGQFTKRCDTADFCQMQQQINYYQNLNDRLDQMIQQKQAVRAYHTGIENTVQLSNDIQQLSEKYELWQDQNNLLISEVSNAQVVLSQLDHNIEQLSLLNQNARERIAELEQQRHNVAQTVMLQGELKQQNKQLQQDIYQQEELIKLLESQTALYQQLIASQKDACQPEPHSSCESSGKSDER